MQINTLNERENLKRAWKYIQKVLKALFVH